MKKKCFSLFLVTVIMGLSGVLQAQVLKDFVKGRKEKAKEEVREKAIDEAGKSADEKIEEGVDRLFKRAGSLFGKEDKEESREPEPEEESNGDSVNEQSPFRLFDGEAVTPARAEYTFDYELEMESVVEEPGDPPATFDLLMLLNEEGGPPYMGTRPSPEEEDVLVIIDFEKNNMITLNDGSAMVMEWNPEIGEDSTAEEEEGKALHIEKTGRTKTIAGYLCEEYRVEDEEGEGVVWLSRKLPVSMSYFYTGRAKSSTLPFSNDEMQGFPMEWDYTSRSDGSRAHMEVKRVEKKQQRFDMSDYRQMKLRNFLNTGKEK